MYPYSRTEYRSHLFGEKCKITVESRHVANDRGKLPNIFNLDAAQLKARKVDFLDIADSSRLDPKSYNEDEDPSSFKSTKTSPARGPLRPGRWFESLEPIICAYKLVTVEFAYKALRSRIESFIHDIIAPIYLRTHRQAVCWMDEWIHLSTADIRKLDIQVAQKLQQKPSASSAEPAARGAPVELATKVTGQPPNLNNAIHKVQPVEENSDEAQQKSTSRAQAALPIGAPAVPAVKKSRLNLRERLHLKAKL